MNAPTNPAANPDQRIIALEKMAKSLLANIYRLSPKHDFFLKNKNLASIVKPIADTRTAKIAAAKVNKINKK